jgi:hypothetical protein
MEYKIKELGKENLPNMGTELQQARIQISGIDRRIEKVAQDKLH